MAHVQTPLPRHSISFSQRLAFLIGSTFLLGFIIDILVIGLPPDPLSPQWRLNFLQQVSERSLLLFMGCILLLYSKLEGRLKQLKLLSIACLTTGLLLGLSSLVMIQDTLTLQQQAVATIDTQATELRTRINQGQQNAALSQQIPADAFSEALSSVESQAELLKQDAQTGAMKTLISSTGNVLLIGMGLIGIGRLGLLKSVSPRQKPRFSLGQIG